MKKQVLKKQISKRAVKKKMERKVTMHLDAEIRNAKHVVFNNYDKDANFRAMETWDDDVNIRTDELEQVVL